MPAKSIFQGAKHIRVESFKWYYFDTDGSLAKNTKADGYKIDVNDLRKAK